MLWGTLASTSEVEHSGICCHMGEAGIAKVQTYPDYAAASGRVR